MTISNNEVGAGVGDYALMLDDKDMFVVVVNHEEQYAIWPANKSIPEKWREVGIKADKEQCLAYIRRVWVDMRPLSVRRRQEG